jgi:P-type Ca2+ transporter type 2C
MNCYEKSFTYIKLIIFQGLDNSRSYIYNYAMSSQNLLFKNSPESEQIIAEQSIQKKLPFHSYTLDKVLLNTNSNLEGLSELDASRNIEQFGYNEITKKDTKPAFMIFLQQFNNPLVYILLAVCVISFGLGKIVDGSVVFVVVFVNALVSFVQELKAEQSVKALGGLVVATARVLRDNNILQIPSREVCVGDILILEEGDAICADARIVSVKNFSTSESSLTGESYSIPKNLEVLDEKADLGDRKNMVWSGTFVASGSAKAVVVNTGDFTVIGGIATSVQNIVNESEFTKKIGTLGKQISLLALFFAFLNFLVGIAIGKDWQENLVFAISSLVSGIPEGLPAILTLVLAIGANKMSAQNAIVRKLYSTETIGSVNVIATDKTGTLTQNTMTVNQLFTTDDEVNITGEGWSFEGNLTNTTSTDLGETTHKALQIATICNKAKVEFLPEKIEVIGDPTEAGLYVLGQKAGLSKQNLENQYAILDDYAFNSNLKMRGTVVQNKISGGVEMFVVGAGEQVLEKCTHILDKTLINLQDTTKQMWLDKIENLSQGGVRVLALAYKNFSKNEVDEVDFCELVFVGMVCLLDPIRPEVPVAVAKCKTSGIRVIMMTGDHKSTALAIAKKANIVDNDCTISYNESDLSAMTDEEFEQAVLECNVFARCTPDRKLRILQTLQKFGQIVAMTGDGVNDGPALKQSDVGISMGIAGTDVARESSEIVLADDNFATIIKAVQWGRVIFNNIQKACLISLNRTLVGMLSILILTIILKDLPFSSVQLLWLNLVTETIIGIGIAFEKGTGEELDKVHEGNNILSLKNMPLLLVNTICMVTVTVGTYYYFNTFNPALAQTASFMVLYFSQFWNLFNFRSTTKSVFSIGLFSNTVINIGVVVSLVLQSIVVYTSLNTFFKFEPLTAVTFAGLLALSSTVLVFGEIYKYLLSKQLR